jgi:hypothetical protein
LTGLVPEEELEQLASAWQQNSLSSEVPQIELDAWQVRTAQDLGFTISPRHLSYARSELAALRSVGEPLRFAFAVLSLVPDTATNRALNRAAYFAFQRVGAGLRPYLDETDLSNRVVARAWRLSETSLEAAVQRRTLRGLLNRVAVLVALDEVRAYENRHRVDISEHALDGLNAEAPEVDRLLDAKFLLDIVERESPEWARGVLPALLLDEIDRDEALLRLNEGRATHGLSAWTMDAMRVWLHRFRAQVRRLMTSAATG